MTYDLDLENHTKRRAGDDNRTVTRIMCLLALRARRRSVCDHVMLRRYRGFN